MPRLRFDTKSEELKYLLWRLVRNPHKMGPEELRYRVKLLRALAKMEGLPWLDGFDENGRAIAVPLSAVEVDRPYEHKAPDEVVRNFREEIEERD